MSSRSRHSAKSAVVSRTRRPAGTWRRDGKNAAFSFDQDIACIGGGGRDEGDPAGLSVCRLVAYPFCQRAGLSKTTAREQQPDLPPIAWWRELVWPGDCRPGILQGVGELRRSEEHTSELQSHVN